MEIIMKIMELVGKNSLRQTVAFFQASKLEKAKLPNSLRSNSGNFYRFCFVKELYKKPPYIASVNILPTLLPIEGKRME